MNAHILKLLRAGVARADAEDDNASDDAIGCLREALRLAELEPVELTDEAEMARRGSLMVDLLDLKEAKSGANSYKPIRYLTLDGTKTALGLYRTCKRYIDEGK